ncbi:MAG: RNA polymerase sigma factor [Gammaproteobacteria bacterium]
MPERSRYFIQHSGIQELFQRHRRDLSASVAGRVSAAADVEDVVQDAYLHLLEQGDLDSVREPRAYLFRTADHLAIDTWRRARRRRVDAALSMEPDRVPDPAPGPEAIADGQLQLKCFLAALDDLPEPCRHALVLNKFEGMTHAEIAARLGVSTKTVWRYLVRAIAHCAARLGR